MNFAQHFFDESHGSGHPDDGMRFYERGDYLCVQAAQHPLHVYRLIGAQEWTHSSIACIHHNGRSYKLAWIEDDEW